jgi:hypothetical protein
VSTGAIAEPANQKLSNVTESPSGAPFAIRDQNPLLAGFGLPTIMPSRTWRDFTAGVDLYWGSTALLQQQGDEALLVDAETREVRVTLQGGLSDRIGWQLQIPYRYTGGGILDGFIDSWHDTFGLAEGARPLLPRDRTNIVYARSRERQLDMRSSASGLGDIQAALGYSIHNTNTSKIAAWLSVELPTGDEDKLTGNGATDVSLLLSAQRWLSPRWSAFGQVAGTWLGESDLLPIEQHDVVWSAMAGVSARAWGGLSLKAQIDAHTAAYKSKLEFFSDAVILTLGGDYRFKSGWRLDLGVSEDAAEEHSPDVVFVIGLKQAW